MNFEEIRIENTNHCSYSCFFCPREEMTRTKGFMAYEEFKFLLNRLPDHSGLIDLHGFGEPLLDRNLARKVELVRSKFPCARTRIYSTLGIVPKAYSLENLISSGLQEIHISFYGVNPIAYKNTHGVNNFSTAKKNLLLLCSLKEKIAQNFKIIVRDFPDHEEVKVPDTTTDEIKLWKIFLNNLPVTSVSRKMHNYGNGRDYNKPTSKNVCSVVWGYRKRVLQVTWDLNIVPCCFDSNSTIVFGNLKTHTLEEIFSSIGYRDFIKSHQLNNLNNYPVCANCERCFKP